MKYKYSLISNKTLATLILDSKGFLSFINAQTDSQTWIMAGTYTPSIEVLTELFNQWLPRQDFNVSECPNGSKCITILGNF